MGALLAVLLWVPVAAAAQDPARRAAALERLAAREAGAGTDPAALAAVGKGYLDLGAHGRALAAAERALETDPQDAEALAVKARALRAGKDLEGALAAYRAIPRGHPQAAVAAAQIRDLEGALIRQGRRGPELGGGIASAQDAPPAAGASFVSRLDRAFGMRGRSGTLDGTIRKAGNGRAASLADLERAGIRFEAGRSDQKDAVEVREEGGRQVVSVSPAVLKSARDARVAAQFGRGLEEAATARDYDGIGEFIRKVGGRVKAVRILIELDAGDKEPKAGEGEADRKLLADRGVVDAVVAGAISNKFPRLQLMQMLQAAGNAKDSGDVSDVGVMIKFISVDPNTPGFDSRSTDEGDYLTRLRNGQ